MLLQATERRAPSDRDGLATRMGGEARIRIGTCCDSRVDFDPRYIGMSCVPDTGAAGPDVHSFTSIGAIVSAAAASRSMQNERAWDQTSPVRRVTKFEYSRN